MQTISMKPVPPTLRMKKRYLAFRINGEGAVSKNDFIKAMNREALRFFGELQTKEWGLWLMEFDETHQTGFIVFNRSFKSEVISVLTLISEIGGQRAAIYALGVSGTIKNLKRKFLKDNLNSEKQLGED